MSNDLSFRPITEQDTDFIYRVYASTRESEMALVSWSAQQKREFLQMQFHAQHAYYQEHYSDAAFDLILLDGAPIGRLYLHRRPDEYRIVDIALLAEHRGKGLGSTLMHRILDEAERDGLPVRIHVERDNPALRLYHRLGFKQISDHGVYYLMEWKPTKHEETGHA